MLHVEPDGSQDGRVKSIRQLLARAGLRPGHRILDLGELLTHYAIRDRELQSFQIVGPREEPAYVGERRTRPASAVNNGEFSGGDADDPDALDASYDAVAALDWWPVTTLAVAVRRWRCLLDRGAGVAIVTGTDIQGMPGLGGQVSEQWINELTSAGFTIDSATRTPTAPRRYTALAVGARRIAAPLRESMGTTLAESYLEHVDRLDRATLHGPSHRFEIIARV